ncbi:MAG: sugar transferase [bacterium]
MLHKSRNVLIILFLGDAVLIVFSFLSGYYARFLTLLTRATGSDYELYISAMVFVVCVWLALFKIFGLYEERNARSFIDEAASIVISVSAGALLLVGLLFLNRSLWFSRQFLFYAWVFAIIYMIFYRYVIMFLQRFLYHNGYFLRRALIIGAGSRGQMLGEKLHNPEHGFDLIGFLDDNPKKRKEKYAGASVLGKISDIKKMIKDHKISEVLVGTDKISDEKILDIITECEVLKVKFKIVPGMLEMLASRVDTDEIGGIPLVSISEINLQGYKAWLKRFFDIILCAAMAILVLPLIALVAILIKLDSKGPVFFRQKRVGKDGIPFYMFKFRTMKDGAQDDFAQVARKGDAKGLYFKMKSDPRITRVGKYLRKYSLDEIPQFFNVVIGDMSLVGPRPPLPHEVKGYDSWHWKRLRVLPGITGLWQVEGKERWDIPFEEVVKLDLLYIENWSLWLDFKILLRTIPAVLSGASC